MVFIYFLGCKWDTGLSNRISISRSSRRNGMLTQKHAPAESMFSWCVCVCLSICLSVCLFMLSRERQHLVFKLRN